MPYSKQEITPGQGLLLLIQHYQDDELKCTVLKNLYINGANTPERYQMICKLLAKEPVLSDYHVLMDDKSIDACPTRRYFETHLAYQTLNYQLKLISRDELEQLLKAIVSLVNWDDISTVKLETIEQVCHGELQHPAFKRKENNQYNYHIKKIINANMYLDFSHSERDKMLVLVRMFYLSLVNGWRDTNMPLDIYNTEQFSARGRGRISRDKTELYRMQNHHFGLLKGHMPLAANDIAYSEKPFEHLKPVDYSTFNSDSPAVQACFMQLVHPFSNSISGSFLVFLRVLARLHCEHRSLNFTTSMHKLLLLLRLIISSGLFYSGGHSLYEYMAILKLSEVKEFFQFLPGFATLDLGRVFFKSNELAFHQALQATIDYNDTIMLRKKVHAELKQRLQFLGAVSCYERYMSRPMVLKKEEHIEQVDLDSVGSDEIADLASVLMPLQAMDLSWLQVIQGNEDQRDNCSIPNAIYDHKFAK